eukprot:2776902-Pyramimonas_sp.AAC.1
MARAFTASVWGEQILAAALNASSTGPLSARPIRTNSDQFGRKLRVSSIKTKWQIRGYLRRSWKESRTLLPCTSNRETS